MKNLEPGDTIGIIGGGQLARMMASAPHKQPIVKLLQIMMMKKR